MARNVDTVGGRGRARKEGGGGPYERSQFNFKDTGTFAWTITDDQAGDEVEIEAVATVVGPPGPPGPPGPGSTGPVGPPGPTGSVGPAAPGFTAFTTLSSGDLLSEPARISSFVAGSGMSAIRHISPCFNKILTVNPSADFFVITGVGGIGGTSATINYQTIVPLVAVNDQIVRLTAYVAGDA